MLCGLFRKNSRLPSAASAGFSYTATAFLYIGFYILCTERVPDFFRDLFQPAKSSMNFNVLVIMHRFFKRHAQGTLLLICLMKIIQRRSKRVGKAKRAHRMTSVNCRGGHGAHAPLPTLRRYRRFGSFALTVCTTKIAVRSIGAVLFSARLNRIAPSSDDST